MNKVRTGCLAALFALLLIPVGMLIGGFVLSTLWGWFVVPLGMPDITLWHTVGLALFVGWFTEVKDGTKSENAEEAVITALVSLAVKTALFLGLGAILVNHI